MINYLLLENKREYNISVQFRKLILINIFILFILSIYIPSKIFVKEKKEFHMKTGVYLFNAD